MPSITGIAACGPMSPSPSTADAVGDDRDVVALDRVPEGQLGVLVDRLADARDARRVGHREVVAGLQRMLVELGDLAAVVQLERAVGPVEQLDALDAVRRPR